jgi:hypothetical protein
MFEPLGLKRDQPSTLRQDVLHAGAARVDAQRAAVLGRPMVVEIQDHRDGAHVRAGQAIRMARIRRPRRIKREMAVEILEPRHQAAVEFHAQFFEPGQQALFGVELRLGQPRNEVPADLGREAFIGAAPDARRPQRAGLVQRAAASAQVLEQIRVDEGIDNAVAARAELLDQARRRERSPRRFACGRRLLRACVVLRFFAGFFFGGHNMVPRHLGEPQRHA